MACPKCGFEMDPLVTTCPRCARVAPSTAPGTRRAPAVPPPAAAAPSTPFIIAVVIVIAGMVGMVVYFRVLKPKALATTTPRPAATAPAPGATKPSTPVSPVPAAAVPAAPTPTPAAPIGSAGATAPTVPTGGPLIPAAQDGGGGNGATVLMPSRVRAKLSNQGMQTRSQPDGGGNTTPSGEGDGGE